MHKFYTTVRGLVKRFAYGVIFFSYRLKVKVASLLYTNQNMKIFVTGFHHSGTSIVRKIIGNHNDVEDIPREVDCKAIIRPNNTQKIYVMKSPSCNDRVFKACTIAKNIKIICILRDPRDVFVSLEKRSKGEYSLEKFKREWCSCVRNALAISKWSNGRLVRYEDLFKDNYKEVKDLFQWLGIPYDKTVITKNTERKTPISGDTIPSHEPPRTRQALFRSYQINQEFKQMSGYYLTELSEEKRNCLENDPNIKELMITLGYA